MSTIINPIKTWFNAHLQFKQWAWFVGLWLGGLLVALMLSYPLKLLIRMAG